MLTESAFIGQTLQASRARLLSAARPGVLLNDITRQGYALPLLPQTLLRRGDVISLTGRASSVEALAAQLGRVRESSYKSDITVHAMAWCWVRCWAWAPWWVC